MIMKQLEEFWNFYDTSLYRQKDILIDMNETYPLPI